MYDHIKRNFSLLPWWKGEFCTCSEEISEDQRVKFTFPPSVLTLITQCGSSEQEKMLFFSFSP